MLLFNRASRSIPKHRVGDQGFLKAASKSYILRCLRNCKRDEEDLVVSPRLFHIAGAECWKAREAIAVLARGLNSNEWPAERRVLEGVYSDKMSARYDGDFEERTL